MVSNHLRLDERDPSRPFPLVEVCLATSSASKSKSLALKRPAASLTAAPEAAVPPALLHGLTAGGKVIEEFIAGSASEKTGEMLPDLDTTVTLDADFRGGIAEAGFSGAQAAVARWVEYGHREVSHGPIEKLIGDVRPHPFMRPASSARSGSKVLRLLSGLTLQSRSEFPLIATNPRCRIRRPDQSGHVSVGNPRTTCRCCPKRCEFRVDHASTAPGKATPERFTSAGWALKLTTASTTIATTASADTLPDSL